MRSCGRPNNNPTDKEDHNAHHDLQAMAGFENRELSNGFSGWRMISPAIGGRHKHLSPPRIPQGEFE
ncbi:hypothetical protein HQ563_05990 [bacterium]|nr:hypothetical protein [bacterium]